jgi:hypothetical protein
VTVVTTLSRFDGFGYVFSPDDPFTGIDLDGCRDPKTGTVASWAKDMILNLDSYAEVSPSLTGVKVWVVAKSPLDSGKKRAVTTDERPVAKEPAIEVYDRGRYFAVTGMKLAGVPSEPQPRQDQLNALCEKFFGAAAETKRKEHEASRLSVIERARKYLDTIPGAVSGQDGHGQTFKAACALVLGFCLTKPEAMVLLSEYNRRCEPPWSERELLHKLDSADKQGGERGYLRDAKGDPALVKLPEYKAPAQNNPRRERQPEETPSESEPRVTTLQAATESWLESLKAGRPQFIEFGIADLDYAIGGGLSLGEYVIAAGRPSHGKTAFVLQALSNIAASGRPVAFVTEEMSASQLGKRTVTYAVDKPEEYWHCELEDVRESIGRHFKGRESCFLIEGCRSVDRVIEQMDKLREGEGIQVFALDYIQRLDCGGKDSYAKVTKATNDLQQWVHDSGCLLIALAQGGRDLDKRKMFLPQMTDLKDSGYLEASADVILFLVWPWMLDKNRVKAEYQIHVLKNKNRETNQRVCTCEFQPHRQRILLPRRTEPDATPQPKRERTREPQSRFAEFDAYNATSTTPDYQEFPR